MSMPERAVSRLEMEDEVRKMGRSHEAFSPASLGSLCPSPKLVIVVGMNRPLMY